MEQVKGVTTMDKYSEVEKLLYNYKMLKISIDNMEQDIKHIDRENGLKGIGFDSISTSPTNLTSDMVSDIAISKIGRMEFLANRIKDNKRKVQSVDKAMEGLEDVERTIIVERYIHARQWWKVASIVKYGERHCKRIRTEAIKKMVVGIYG